MSSYEFNGKDPHLLTTNGFRSTDFASPHERIFYYENTKFLWKELMKINTAYIMATKDISTLEPYVENILYSKLKFDDIDLLSNEYIIQLVILIQLTGQYLVYTQKRLEFENQELREKIYELDINLKDSQKYQTLIDNLNRQNQEKDFLIKTYQNIIQNGNGTINIKNVTHNIKSKTERDNNKINLRNKNDGKLYYCKICKGKGFKSQKFLEEHIQRRHYDIIDIESNKDYQEEKEINIEENKYKEIFDKKIDTLKSYFEKLLQQNKESDELNYFNKKFDYLSNQIILQNNAILNNQNNQNIICSRCKQNINGTSQKNINIVKKEQNINENIKLELENAKELKKLNEKFNKQIEVNNELKLQLKEKENEIEKLKMYNLNNLNDSNNKKETILIKTDKQITNVYYNNNNSNNNDNENNENKINNFNNKSNNENKENKINNSNLNLNNNIKASDSYKNDFKSLNSNDINNNNNNNDINIQGSYKGDQKMFTNTGDNPEDNFKKKSDNQNQNQNQNEKQIDININPNIDNEKIDININKGEIDMNQQTILKDINKNPPNMNIDENNEIKEENKSKNNDEKKELFNSISKKSEKSIKKSNENKEEDLRLSLLGKKIIKRDNEFYSQELINNKIIEDYNKINEIKSKYKNDDENLEQKIEKNIEEKELKELIEIYKNNKRDNVKGKDIYKILGIDKIIRDYNIYMGENNTPDGNSINDNKDNTNNNEKKYSLKTSNIEDTKIRKTISADESKNFYSRKPSIIEANSNINNPEKNEENNESDKKNILESSIGLLMENQNKKTGIVQNSVINYDLTNSVF